MTLVHVEVGRNIKIAVVKISNFKGYKAFRFVLKNKNDKNNVIVLSVEQYKEKLLDEEIEKKLLKAEKQIEEGKIVKAADIFKELEEKYGF